MHMKFVIIVCVNFIQHTPDMSFLANNFAYFLDVQVRKSRFNPVIGGMWYMKLTTSNFLTIF